MALTDAQIEQYRSKGWVAPIDVLSPADAGALAAMLTDAEQRYPDQLHAEHRNNAHLVFPFLSDIARHPAIVSAAASLVGPDLMLSSTVLFIKGPDSAAFVSWHQDAFYMGLAPSNFVTAWLALTPSTIESGCVSVIPGTHTKRAEHVDTFGEANILTRGQEVSSVDASTAVHLELQPGQMSLHHPWLVHGSQPNRSASRRVGIAMQSYLAADVRPIHGDHHVMHVSGAAPHESFIQVPAPESECSAEALVVRAAANAALAGVLYEGAAEQRAF